MVLDYFLLLLAFHVYIDVVNKLKEACNQTSNKLKCNFRFDQFEEKKKKWWTFHMQEQRFSVIKIKLFVRQIRRILYNFPEWSLKGLQQIITNRMIRILQRKRQFIITTTTNKNYKITRLNRKLRLSSHFWCQHHITHRARQAEWKKKPKTCRDKCPSHL